MKHRSSISLLAAFSFAVMWPGNAHSDEAAAPPRAVSIGTEGLLQPSALIQTWYSLQKPEGASLSHQFRIRRTEIKLKGEIVPKKLSFDLMVDPAQVAEKETSASVTVSGKDSTGADITDAKGAVKLPKRFSILQDAMLTYKHEWCEASVGQFKIPLSYEGFNSSSKIVFPDRAMISKKLGDKRDIGIRFAKTFPMFSYNLGIYNGSGQNTKDEDDGKDIGLRLEGYPIGGLTVAGVYYQTVGAKAANGDTERMRYEFDLRYEQSSILVQGEFMGGQDETSAGKTKPLGFYVLAGYTIGDFQPVLRFGQLDPDTSSGAEGDDGTQAEAGVNYFLPGLKQHEAKIQLAGGQFSRGAEPKKDGKKEIQVTTVFQIAF